MVTFLLSALVVLIIASLFGLPFFLNWLADGNILYTKVKEGTAKAIMSGKSLNHLVMSLRGYHLNDPKAPWYEPDTVPDWQVVKNAPGVICDNRTWLEEKLGIYFVGLPPFRKVYTYTFAWKEMTQDEATGKDKVWSRTAETEFIFVVPFPYIMKLTEAETNEGMPVDVEYQLTIRVINPFLALFDTENWMEAVSGSANAAARNFVGSNCYKDLMSEIPTGADKPDSHRFSKLLIDLNDALADGSAGLKARYGVEIIAADVQEVALSGPHRETLAASSVKRYTANQDAYATETAGKADAEAKRAVGTAEADIIKLKGDAEASAFKVKGEAEVGVLKLRLAALAEAGDMGRIVTQAEAMASTGPGKTVIWANNPFFTESGLADELKKAGITNVEELMKHINSLKNKEE